MTLILASSLNSHYGEKVGRGLRLRNSWRESLNSKPRRETRAERERYRKENEEEEVEEEKKKGWKFGMR